MPSKGHISCNLIRGTDLNQPFREVLVDSESTLPVTCYIPIGKNPNPCVNYGQIEHPYSVSWSIDPSLLREGGIQVQIEVDGCQKGQPRCYEAISSMTTSDPIIGIDNGLWVVPDGSRRRPWIMGPIKTAHPHSALADKYILDRVGSVSVTFKRATVVPTSLVVPLVPVFNGSAPLPDRMKTRLSHWTKLGYIERHAPAPELGLVAEEIGCIIASFTFHYRSEDLLKWMPQSLLDKTQPTAAPAFGQIHFPMSPSTPDNRSIKSAEPVQLSFSEPTTGGGHKSGGFRRAFSSANSKRMSLESTASLADKKTDKEESVGSAGGEGKSTGKLAGRRVRAVSLRVTQRYSLLNQKSHDKKNKKSGDEMSPANDQIKKDDSDMDTVEGLKRELILLKLEVTALKSYLNL